MHLHGLLGTTRPLVGLFQAGGEPGPIPSEGPTPQQPTRPGGNHVHRDPRDRHRQVCLGIDVQRPIQQDVSAGAIEAIDMLFENSGAGALNVDSPIQRFWRDAHGGRVHAANDPERAYVAFGNGEFGLPIGDTMV